MGIRVVGLKVENVMRLRAAEVKPGDAPVVTVSGANASGKTSLLRSMLMALEGARSIPGEPIHRGESKGSVELDLGSIRAKLALRKGKSPKLVVTDADGATLKKPQTILNELRSGRTLDVRRFAEMDGAGRIDVVKGLTGLDFTDHDVERAEVFEQRKAANAEVKRLAGAVESAPFHYHVPGNVVSVAKLTSEAQLAAEANAANDRKREALSEARRNAEAQIELIATLREKLETAEAEFAHMQTHGKALAAEVELLADVDVAAIVSKIDTAEETNAKVRANTEREKLVADLNEAEEAAEVLTDALAKLDAKKADAIANAQYPIDGLAVGDDDVTLNGFEFAQAGGAERLVAAAAIELALHPDLRVVYIDEGGNIDRDGRDALAKWAEANDAQIWLVLAGEEPGTIIIEDGMVRDASE